MYNIHNKHFINVLSKSKVVLFSQPIGKPRVNNQFFLSSTINT